uniref:BACK domain-containing protein n=1 Tax=Panagrellus redivivus TaxID=6233 RepID=A0A7E4ZZ17_PANRE
MCRGQGNLSVIVDTCIVDAEKLIEEVQHMQIHNILQTKASKGISTETFFSFLKRHDHLSVADVLQTLLLMSDANFQSTVAVAPRVFNTFSTIPDSKRMPLNCNRYAALFGIKQGRIVDYHLAGQHLFACMEDWVSVRVNNVIKRSIKFNATVFQFAERVATQVGCVDATTFMDIIECVDCQIKANPALLEATLVKEYNDCMNVLTKIGCNFNKPSQAVYHFMKHGAEFGFEKYEIEKYVKWLPSQIFTTENIVCRQTNSDNSTKTDYIDRKNDWFGVLYDNGSKVTINTMFVKEGAWRTHKTKMDEIINNVTAPAFKNAFFRD